MADPFDSIDPGQDFEDFAVGLSPITVKRIDPDTNDATTTVEGVPATMLIRRRSRFAVGDGGELGDDAREFLFRANRLEFVPKQRDQIVTAAGVVYTVERAALEAFDALCRVTAVIKR
jgi:hypothetical protein